MELLKSQLYGDIRRIGKLMTALHTDERGDNENLGRLLILALILIPLIILIVFFGQQIATEAKAQWDKLFGKPVKPGV
ncbi:MAG TPA: hypothetical protein PKK10_02465 [Woeseiaceae bacterium]|nr:hypothetical protein [Woeseiaceae bacterium]